MRARAAHPSWSGLPLALLIVVGCSAGGTGGRSDPSGRASVSVPAPPPAEARDGAATAASAAAGAVTTAGGEAAGDWREELRLHRWERGYAMLAALSAEERASPSIRLALGVAALRSGQHTAAVGALAGLGAELPAVRELVTHWYAEAAAVVGPYDEAAAILLASPRTRDEVLGAEALSRAGAHERARKAIDAAVRHAQRERRRRDEILARGARAAIAEQRGDHPFALAEHGWLLREHPEHERACEALAAVERLGGRLDSVARIEVLVQSCAPENLPESLAALDALTHQAGQRPAAATIAMARARALGTAGDWGRAADAYAATARMGSALTAEASYYAGRSAARAGREDEALTRFREVAGRFGKSPWAERARLREAELLLQLGRDGAAATAFDRYLSRFGRGSAAESARYGQALALLGSGQPAWAAKLLATLRKDARPQSLEGSLRQLEGVAADRAGERARARSLWLGLVRERPLTWPALCAHARLAAAGERPLPPLVAEPASAAHLPLSVPLPAGPSLLRSLGLDTAAEQQLGAHEQAAALSHPGREHEALCELYAPLAPAMRRYRIGSRAASAALFGRGPTEAERWAWGCAFPCPFAAFVAEQERRFGVPAGLVHAVMRQESTFDTAAVSSAGARGLMQLMPATARRAAAELGLEVARAEIARPDVNVTLGTFYLGKLLVTFGGSLPVALAAYNAGPHAVAGWLRGHGNLDADLWVARIPFRETRYYVAQVLSNYARYQWLGGGAGAVTALDLALPSGVRVGDADY